MQKANMRNNLGQVVTASWFNYCVVDFLPFLRGLTPLVHLSASRSKDNSISDNIKIKIRCLVCTVGWRNQWQRLESDDVVSTRCCHMSHNTESVISKKNEWLTTDISRFNPIRLFLSDSLKEGIYIDKPATIPEGKENIRRAISEDSNWMK